MPNTIKNIGYRSFLNCRSLTSIDLPEGLTSIGDSALIKCTSLTSITIPNNVVTIGERTFRGCTGLTSVTIGTGVQSIGGGAFYGCTALTKLYCNAVVPPTLSGTSVFFYCTFTLYVSEESVDAYKNSDWGTYMSES